MIASAYARANESARTGPDAPKNDQTKQNSNQAKIESNYIDEPTDWTNTVKIEVRGKIKPKQRKNEPIKLLDEEVCDDAWLRKRKKSR